MSEAAVRMHASGFQAGIPSTCSTASCRSILLASRCSLSPLQRLIDYYGIKLDGKRLVLMVEDPKVGHAALCCAAPCCAAPTTPHGHARACLCYTGH